MFIPLSAGAYGALVWLVISIVSGKAEAWDSELYWLFGQPALLIGVGILGWLAPEKSWRWGICMSGGQAAMLLILGLIDGGGFGLLPLGLVMFMIMSVPLMMVSMVIALIRRKIFTK